MLGVQPITTDSRVQYCNCELPETSSKYCTESQDYQYSTAGARVKEESPTTTFSAVYGSQGTLFRVYSIWKS